MLSNETCLLVLLAKISNFFHCMFHLSINLVFDGVFVKSSFPLHIGKLFLVSSSLILNLLFKIFELLSWYYVNVRLKNLFLCLVGIVIIYSVAQAPSLLFSPFSFCPNVIFFHFFVNYYIYIVFLFFVFFTFQHRIMLQSSLNFKIKPINVHLSPNFWAPFLLCSIRALKNA